VEGHPFPVEIDQAVIADRDAMGIAPEIPEHGRGSAKGRLGVDDPLRAKETVDKGAPGGRLTKRGGGATEIELATRKTRLKTFTGRKKPAYFGRIQR
jgi:hypothetical protein